eukprot:3438030-Rhodomonas_salina.2
MICVWSFQHRLAVWFPHCLPGPTHARPDVPIHNAISIASTRPTTSTSIAVSIWHDLGDHPAVLLCTTLLRSITTTKSHRKCQPRDRT